MILVKTTNGDLINITDLAGIAKEERIIKVYIKNENKTFFTIDFTNTEYNIDLFLKRFYEAILQASKFGAIIDIEQMILDLDKQDEV